MAYSRHAELNASMLELNMQAFSLLSSISASQMTSETAKHFAYVGHMLDAGSAEQMTSCWSSLD